MRMACSVLMAGLLCATAAIDAQAAVDPAALGHMKAVLALCTRSNPQKASEYLLQMKSMIGDATREAVEQASRTDAYAGAYESVRSDLGSRAPEDVGRVCDSYLSSAR